MTGYPPERVFADILAIIPTLINAGYRVRFEAYSGTRTELNFLHVRIRHNYTSSNACEADLVWNEEGTGLKELHDLYDALVDLVAEDMPF